MKKNFNENFSVIQDFGANLNISVWVSDQKNPQLPSLIIKSNLNSIVFSLNPGIYKKLQEIGKAFALEDSIKDNLTTDKQILLKSKVKTGLIWCYNAYSSTWKEKYAIMSGNYIHLYDSEEHISPSSQLYIVNTILQNDDSNVQKDLYSFVVNYIKY